VIAKMGDQTLADGAGETSGLGDLQDR
jgi:hypothetical protein